MKVDEIRRLRTRVHALAQQEQAARAAGQEPPTYDPEDAACECGQPRSAHGGDAHRGSVRDPDKGRTCLRYRTDRLDLLARRAHASLTNSYGDDLRAFERMQASEHTRDKARRGDETSVRPSDLGTCPHRVSLRILQPDGLFTNITDGRARRQGSVVHRDRANIVTTLYPWRRTEVEYRLPGLKNTFFADEYDPVTGDVFETKTAGDWQWKRTLEDGAEDSWLDQALLEAFGLELAGNIVRRVRIVVVQRADGHDLEFTIAWDDTARSLARKALGRLLAMQVAIVQQRQILPRGRTGPTTDPICRSHCEMRDFCWNLPRAQQLGVSPESLDVLGEAPTDEQLVWALRTYYERKTASEAAKSAVDEARSWVIGRPPGVYPGPDDYDYVIADGSAPRPQYGKWREAVLAELDRPEHLRRRPDEIPVPKGDAGDLTIRRRVKRTPKKPRTAAPALAEVPAPVEQTEQPAAESGAA